MEYVKFRLTELKDIAKILGEPADLVEMTLRERGYIEDVDVDPDYDAQVFARVYLNFRRRMRHQGQKLITRTSGQWLNLKSVTEEAVNFCECFDYSNREGFIQFLEIGESNEWTSLQKLKYNGHKITEEAILFKEINESPSSSTMYEIIDEFSRAHLSRYGYTPAVNKTLDFKPFYNAALLADELKIPSKVFVAHLVDKWEWTGGLKPHQLSGDKAREYLMDWKSVNHPTKRVIKKVSFKRGLERF